MRSNKLLGGLSLCGLLITPLVIVGGQTLPARQQPNAPKQVTSKDLGGAERYLGHVSTDKPIYRPNEKVYIRSVVLQAANHKPLTARAQPPALIRITGPKGDTVASSQAQTLDSVSGFAWKIPADQAGGEYKIKVTYPTMGIAPAERKFDIRAYRAPRLKSQIKFLRDGYGPGDTVAATLEVKRAEGGIPEGAKVTVIARVDGLEIHKSAAKVTANGHCSARFRLPEIIARGEGTLAFVIKDGGVVETATKTIPILLQTVDLAIYPEGGDLVAGLPNRVYIEAKTPAKKPADIAGVMVDEKGARVASFRTEHEGRGRFTFTPKHGQTYALKIIEPSGINKTFPLPAVKEDGVVLRAMMDRYPKGQPVELRVISAVDRPLAVTLSKREVEIAKVNVRGGQESDLPVTTTVTLTPPDSADGILIATVWGRDGQPLAERLIYREPARSLHVDVTADTSEYVPGGKAKLTVKTTDDAGKPIGAVVGLTVTDDSVLEMIEKRGQAPRLPVMVLLESDVKELADAHVYLDPNDPKAPLAVDLLLGTQGWRRFAFVDAAKFLAKHGDAGRRVLAMKVVTRRELRMMRRKGMGRGGWAVNGLVEEAEGVPPQARAAARPDVARKHAALKDSKKAVALRPPAGAAAELQEALAVAQEQAADLVAGKLRLRRKLNFVIVREYAHRVRPDRKPGDRRDFTETLYWHAGVKTDAKTGQATVGFDLSDAVTSFRVFADAFAENGALGSHSEVIESVEPFYVEPKLPLEVTMGDEVLLPISVVNATSANLDGVTLDIKAAKGIDVSKIDPFTLAGNARVRQMSTLKVGSVVGDTDFVLAATAGPYADRVTRTLRVVPRGFPVELAHGGMLEPNGALKFLINIPNSRVVGSVTSDIAVYPTPLANLTQAMERLIREPYGCFEQTSSTTYPLVMAQQYFLSHQGIEPRLIERSSGLLDKGYKRLISFECKKRGYEWFGADPGHEALSAYGLLEFTDMAKVRQVDQAMLARTRTWVLATRDGKGGFKRQRRSLHTWIADPDCSNGYITWAMLESGERADSLAAEIDTVKSAAAKNANSYVIALGANVASLAGDKKAARKLMDKLVARQTKDGSVGGGTMSIVGSGGQALKIETTSLAVLAWLGDAAYTGSVEKAMRWLIESCKAGRFGSTQSTVLALRAIVEYDRARAKPKAPGSVLLSIDGHRAGSPTKFDKDTHGAIKLTNITEMLDPGQHTIEIRMTDGSAMPCSVTVSYHNETPASSPECKIGLEVALSNTKVVEGGVTEANVVVSNLADKAVPTTVAIIGIPGGLEVRHDQLKELVKAGRIAAYEVIGREVVLYWRSLKANQKVALPISLVAAIPGTYTAPASRAYLYYTDEYKQWTPGLRATIPPRAG